MSLSQYGKELMQDVEEILDVYLRMEERAAGLKNQKKTVRIGTVTGGGIFPVLEKCLKMLRFYRTKSMMQKLLFDVVTKAPRTAG